MNSQGPDFTPLPEALAGLAKGERVWWGCEYVMPLGVDGREYHLVHGLDTEIPECIELTLGVGTTVTALELSVPRECCDGVVLFMRDPDWSEPAFEPDKTYPDLIWAGPWDHPSLTLHIDDSCGLVAIPAISFVALGALVGAELSLLRPDLTLFYDPWNHHHTSPTVTWLSANLEDEHYMLTPSEQGRPELQVTGQVMDVLLALELSHLEHLTSLSPDERTALVITEAWLDWTDGTYDADRLAE